jgi:hypothetical protein
MRILRGHLRATALAIVIVVTATVTVGALRTCWGGEHRHAGAGDPACAMHHGDHGVPAAEAHGHHAHGADPASTSEGPHVRCNCATDADAPLMPTAIVAAPAVHQAPAASSALPRAASPRVPYVDRTPLTPPPRPAFS